MTDQQFKAKHDGKFIEYNNDPYKNQCMDMLYLYLKDVCGIDPRPYQGWGSAINLWNAAKNGKIKDFSKHFRLVKNGATNHPSKGNPIFWGFYLGVTGFAGHVAIDDASTSMTVASYDQNFPTKSPCHYQKHSYKGVQGWWEFIG